MKFSGHVGHATIFISEAYCCVWFCSGITVWVRFGVWLVSGYRHAFILLSLSLYRTLLARCSCAAIVLYAFRLIQ